MSMGPSSQFIKGDLQSGDLLTYVLSTERIDTVLHFAAQVRAPFTCCMQPLTELMPALCIS